MHFHPALDNIPGGEKYFRLSNFVTTVKTQDIKNDEKFHVIDDKTLNEFIQFYSDKTIDSMEIFEKEEARYILEMMGKHNTNELKSLLNTQSNDKEQRIITLLNENLFDEQLMILNQMLN